MTIDELLAREAIRDTLAKYNTSGDRLKAEDYAACFTEDGIIESERVSGEKKFRYEGRAAILDWQNRWRNREPGQDTVHNATFIRHHLSTCRIEMTGPEGARVRTYWAAWTDIGPDHAGYYLDDFRKVGDQWLIAHRRVRLDWESEQGLFKSAVANSNPDG
jgi:3-phenylpropionate/cinnamic acid dioxygenase small subunit